MSPHPQSICKNIEVRYAQSKSAALKQDRYIMNERIVLALDKVWRDLMTARERLEALKMKHPERNFNFNSEINNIDYVCDMVTDTASKERDNQDKE